MLDKAYMKKVSELLKEADRMDLWKHVFETDKPEDPEDFVIEVIAEHPDKPEKIIREVRKINC
tara:strand:+ start:491 stop:679 length:189 start_codon:yes stop_codon:yes gene_type:complete